MAGRLLVPGWTRALDSDGDPIPARISLFDEGTDALAPVYSDEALTIPLANPVQSNSAGRFPAVWAADDQAYDWSVEAPYGPPGSPFTGTGLTVALAADVLAADAAEAAADAAEASAAEALTSENAAEAALAEILDLAANAPDAPSIVNKANLNGGNVTGANATAFLTAVGAGLPGLTAASDVQDSDLLPSYRSTGPLKKLTAAILGNYVIKTLTAFLQAGTGAVARTPQSKMRETISIADFGAVGDDLTDDSVAINRAYAAAEAAGGAAVIWPRGTYYTNLTTVTCGPLSATMAQDGAVLHYVGNGDAMVIDGVNTSETIGRNHFLPAIRRKGTIDWNLGTDTTSVGLRIRDCKYSNFFLQGIKRFDRGIVLETVNANAVCNKFYLGVVQNCRRSIDLSGVVVPWGINQNTFIGGSCVVDSAVVAVVSDYIYMPNTENNTNVFLGVNLEKGGNTKAVTVASSDNLFLDCRFEGSSSASGYITVSGNNNKFIGGAPSSSATPPFVTWVTDTGSGNVFWMANVLAGKFFAVDFHSAARAIRLGNGSAYPDYPIGSGGALRGELGDSTTLSTRVNGLLQQVVAPVTSGTQIAARNATVLTMASPTTITGLTPALALTNTSAIVGIVSTNGNATLEHAAAPAANAGRFVLSGGANLLLAANVPVLFMLAGGNLYQLPTPVRKSANLTPVSVAANTTAEQTFAVTGLRTTDHIMVNGPAATAGTGIVSVRVSAADTLAITFANLTSGPLTPASGIYSILSQ